MLDNPVWGSLTTLHRSLALRADGLARYPADVAPFLAIEQAGPLSPAGLAALVAPGETVLLVGPRPVAPPGWRLEDVGPLYQMVCRAPLPAVAGPPIAPLHEPAAILALAALVYPHYFRPRTPILGRYHGVIGDDGALQAMLGERMGMPGLRELSAICTHPAHVGRGLARRLIAFAANELLARGETPFLHVSPANDRAWQLYERNGFQRRVEIDFFTLTAPGLTAR